MEKKARIITPQGDIKYVQPENGTDFTLEELRRHVDCDVVEILTLGGGMVMVVDEEGKLKKPVYNSKATCEASISHAIHPWDCIVGNALICPTEMIK